MILLPPEIMAQLGDDPELEIQAFGHGVYIETASEARKREEGLQQLGAILARRRAAQPDAEETQENIEEIVRTVKEVRHQHAATRSL